MQDEIFKKQTLRRGVSECGVSVCGGSGCGVSGRGVFVPEGEILRQLDIAAKVRALNGGGKKVFVATFGCQQNESDGEKLLGLAALMGYEKTENIDEAQLVIFNTCAVREHAELKVFSKAGDMRRLKERDKSAVTAVCGCMIEEAGVREKFLASYPYIDLLFGTDRVHTLPEMVYGVLRDRRRRVCVSDLPHADFGVVAEGVPLLRESTYKAWVPVMYGCDNFCSYCVVPHVRGRERSRRSADVLSEVEGLVRRGYKDITLLGQNVNSYAGDMGFPELLERAANFEGDYFLRFVTSHPKDASRELADVMAANPKIAPHFHLPLQSGDNRVLGMMNRRYTVEQYGEKAAYIKERIPDVALTSDIICGFPTETDAEFENTLKAVDEIGFDMLFAFIYSPRPGTPAARLPQIPHRVKTGRFALLSELENARAEVLNARFGGRTLKVLSDGAENGVYKGRTGQNKIVSFTLPEGFGAERAAAGRFLDVLVTETLPYTLRGVAVK